MMFRCHWPKSLEGRRVEAPGEGTRPEWKWRSEEVGTTEDKGGEGLL